MQYWGYCFRQLIRSLLCISVKFYNYSVLVPSPQNEIQLLSSFFGFLKLNCLFGFSSRKKVSHRKGIYRWLCLRQFMQALAADNRSFSKDFQFLSILVLPLPPQKQIQLVWGGLRHGIQVEHKGFYSRVYRKSFGRHLLAYSGAASKLSLSNYCSFELFCF